MGKLELLKRRDRAAELYLQGKTQAQISEELEVSVATVCRDLQWVQKQWVERSVRNMDEIKAEQLARIDWVERQATEAWFRSLEDAERVMVTVDEDDSEGGDHAGKKTTETKGQSGNDKYLARIAWCVEQRLKIFGLYAPTKIAPTNLKGDSAFSLDVVVRGLTDDQLEALKAANDQLHRVTTGTDDGRHD